MPTIPAASDSIWWFYVPAIALGVAIVIGVPIAYKVWKEAKGEADDETTKPDDLLGPLSAAYAKGQMSTEEYKRARDSILRSSGLLPPSSPPIAAKPQASSPDVGPPEHPPTPQAEGAEPGAPPFTVEPSD
jgi:hypothetical protein